MNSWWLLVFKLNAKEIKKYFYYDICHKSTIECIRWKYYKLQLQYRSTFKERIDRSLKVFIVTVYIYLV